MKTIEAFFNPAHEGTLASSFETTPAVRKSKKQWHTPGVQTLGVDATAGGPFPGWNESTTPGLGQS